MDVGTLTVTMGANTAGLVRAQQAMLKLQQQTIKSVNTMNASLNTLSAQMTKVAVTSKVATQSMVGLGTALSSVTQKFRTFGYLATAMVTMPIVMLGKSMAKTAMDFEYNLAKIEGLVGVSRLQVDMFKDSILKMSAELGRKPTELADAMYFITTAGFRGAEAVNILNAAVKGSVSGMGDVKTIADGITSAMNAWGSATLSASKFMDILTATVREGKTEATGLVGALGMVYPGASRLGIQLNEVGAAVAAMTRTGTPITTATMQLRQYLFQLQKIKPGSAAQKALIEMGSSGEELRNILRGERGLVNSLLKLKELTEFKPQKLALIMPNVRSWSLVADIIGPNFEKNMGIWERMADNVGDANRAFEVMANTMKQKFAVASAKASVIAVSFGDSILKSILPVVEKWIIKLENLQRSFDGLTDAQKQHKLQWVAFIAILGPASLLISLVGYALGGLLNVFNAIRLAMIANPFALAIVGILALLVVFRQLEKGLVTITNDFKYLGKTQIDQIWGDPAALEKIASLTANIAKRMPYLSIASESQREELKTDIDAVIKLYEDKRLNLLTIAKEGLKDDKFILDQKAKLIELETALAFQRSILETSKIGSREYELALSWVRGIEKGLNNVKGVLKDYKSEMKSAFDAEVESVETNIEYYGKLAAEVKKTMDIIQAYKDAVQADIDLEDARQDTIDGAWDTLLKTLSFIDDKSKIFKDLGMLFDANGERLSALTSGFDTFVKEGLSPTSKELGFVIKKLKEFEKINITKIKMNVPTVDKIGAFKELKAPAWAKWGEITKSDMSGGLYKGEWAAEAQAIAAYNDSLRNQTGIINELADSFEAMFKNVGGGFKGMIDSMLNALRLLGAEILGKIAIFGVLQTAFVATDNMKVGEMAATALTSLKKFLGITGAIVAVKAAELEITGATAAAETAKAAATAAGIPVTLAAAAAETTKAAASTAAATAGAASSVAWIPIVGIGLAVAGVVAIMAALTKAKSHKMAAGGIVPSGYPNDTYPALLTSGETVTPPGKLDNINNSGKLDITIHGKLHGRDIYISNERYSKILNDNT